MIWESAYWKDGLLRSARDLRRRFTQRRWPEASLAKLEQQLMLGFYSIRKLVEAKKLSDAIVASQLSLQLFPIRRGARVTRLNWHRVDEHYDFDAPTTCTRKLEFICNQLIHSYVFIPVFADDGGIEAIWFASDRDRSKRLYGLSLQHVADLFDAVGYDYSSGGVFVEN